MEKRESVKHLAKKYPRQWLLLADVKVDRVQHPLQGRLITHDRNLTRIYKKIRGLKGHLCLHFSGPYPKKVAYQFRATITI